MSESEDSTALGKNEKFEPVSNPKNTENNNTDDETKENPEPDEDSVENSKKRENPNSEPGEETLKRQKSIGSNDFSFLDVIKSVVKEDASTTSGFNVLTNTKEYDCPIAKLAKMDPGQCFFKMPKAEDASTNSSSVADQPEEDAQEPEKEEANVQLEPSMSETERLLQEVKECKLSVYRNSEWSMPVPVVTHLILDKESFNKRVVCFQQGTGKLLLNTFLAPSMSFNKLKTKSIIFTGRTLGEDSEYVPHRLVFPDSCVRDEFHQLYSV